MDGNPDEDTQIAFEEIVFKSICFGNTQHDAQTFVCVSPTPSILLSFSTT